ncbi:MAG TPA: hypothetical protein VG818_02595 [Gemmatimonadaceae bacterium]|nr:hypothetical protein [Gemmatimonadaceae bacterium]
MVAAARLRLPGCAGHEVVHAAIAGAPLASPARAHPERGRRDERRHEHHEHDGPEKRRVNGAAREPHLCEDQPHLAAWHHRHADQQAVAAAPPGHEPGDHLAEDADGDESGPGKQCLGARERAPVHGGADAREEDRHEEVPDRRRGFLDHLPLRQVVQHEPGRERADDHRRARGIRQPRKQERERDCGEPQGAGGLDALDDAEDRRRHAHPHEHGHDHECGRDAGNAAHAAHRDGVAGDDPSHHGQDHQPDDVVDHGRPEHDAPLARVQAAEFGQHARRDADRRGAQRRAAHQRRHTRDAEHLRGQEPEPERDRHARDSDRSRDAADLHERADVGLEADLEQQQDHADLGHRVDDRIRGVHEPERRATEQHAGHEFPEHCRLAQALRELAEQLGADEDRDQRGKERRHRRASVGGSGRCEQQRRSRHHCAASPSRYV